ncbi:MULTISPECIES: GNAT family N-acetyltransferase [Lysobacter]|uniref:GNAT family N-acetyltransferase n=1 Tax=Lysobacter TaxID=68 RepID=UPI001F25A073|nr:MULTISPECIES: GNAT family N-acetyltransferase [Lysobacter]UJB17339.1 GNAT family N-acetyltransferase [Lysobacter capsici]UJQ28938.1 GNAT family N-acetyltransferase [Lysobacter gummosus]
MTQPAYEFVPATDADLPRLLPVLHDFYQAEHLPWNEPALRRALATLIADPNAGRLRLIVRDGEIAGYFVLGFCFSLEFGGRFGLLDELFVLPAHRGGGLAKRALAEVEALCRAEGLDALRLEVNDDNAHARGIYERAGYIVHPRRLMTLWLRD